MRQQKRKPLRNPAGASGSLLAVSSTATPQNEPGGISKALAPRAVFQHEIAHADIAHDHDAAIREEYPEDRPSTRTCHHCGEMLDRCYCPEYEVERDKYGM
mgnify:CR=1 FL=1